MINTIIRVCVCVCVYKGRGDFPGSAVVKNLPANVGDTRDTSSIPGLERFPGAGNGNPLQYSFLENFIDRGAWQSMGSQWAGHNWAIRHTHKGGKGFPGGSLGKELACNVGDAGLIAESGRSPGAGHGNPLQYSCLENPVDRGAWRATVHSVTESDTTEATEYTHKGEGGHRGYNGWMASTIQWTWIWANSRRQWRTGKSGMLQSMGL